MSEDRPHKKTSAADTDQISLSAESEQIGLDQSPNSATVSLAPRAEQLGFNETMTLRRQILSEELVRNVVTLFRVSVLATYSLTFALLIVDTSLIWCGKSTPDQRMLSGEVIMAIVGASIVQLGGAVAAIIYSIFGKPPSDDAKTGGAASASEQSQKGSDVSA